MGYEIVDGQIIETYDLNEIRNTMIIWEMPEEDEKLIDEHTKNRLEIEEIWNDEILPHELRNTEMEEFQ